MKLNRTILRCISLGLLILALLEVFQGKLGIKIDSTTVIIVGLAILIFILPDLSNLSKFKYGDIEIEFEKKIDALEKLVTAEENIGKPIRKNKPSLVSWENYYKEYYDILNSNSHSLEKILRASQLIEHMIAEAAKDFGLADKVDIRSSSKIINELRKNELITEEELSILKEFRSLRNKIIHGDIKELSNSLTTRILDLLGRIVKIFG